MKKQKSIKTIEGMKIDDSSIRFECPKCGFYEIAGITSISGKVAPPFEIKKARCRECGAVFRVICDKEE